MIGRLAVGACLGLVLLSSPAGATFRGENGLIAFNRSTDHGFPIFSVSPDGSGETMLVQAGDGPAWSPDGKRIVYERRVARLNHNLYVADANGTNIHRLRLRSDDCDPSWSPGGQRIVFVLAYDCGQEEGAWIATVRPNGTGLRRLLRGYLFFTPVWSPDGRRIAFVCIDEPDMEHTDVNICVMRADGKSVRTVTNTSDPVWNSAPSWSPDGKQLLFQREGDILVYSIATNQTRVLIGGVTDDEDPAWSPDGKKIVVERVNDAGDASDLYIADADGQNVHLLVTNGWAPDWQPVR